MTNNQEPISLTLQVFSPPDVDDEEVFDRTLYLKNEIEISYPSTAVPQVDVQQWLEAMLAKRAIAVTQNQSGGISVDADHVGVSGDMVAGNKIVNVQTMIVNQPPTDVLPAGGLEEYQ